ncbi:hypothetical protein EDB92DRAFT_706652 [Lactarius akahatsu]|uniref:C2 domain-containing protein n=1 Tax=Lactarius akahatsu TaxID=416441 RepID=A0AAD4Q7V2_9AGAM|nr:hypothetical protein EDB92DRAFT_706652 [Lactarius akahatsu]
MPGQKLSMVSTQIAESRGSQSQPIGVGVTVIRARNIPHIKTTFGRKREFFVTIAYGATTKKTEKQTEKRTKSVRIDGRTAVWDQRLDTFFIQPSSHLNLCLYAKRLTKSDILVGTHEMVIPNESESNISVTLGDGNGQAGQSTSRVTLDLMITVSANRTPPSDLPNILTEGDDTLTEGVPKPTMAPDSRRPDRSSAPDYLLPPPDHIPVQSSFLMTQDQGEMSLVEKARFDLDRADEVEKLVDGSKTWEGVVGKIKWVMDTLSPVAELHPIAQMAHKVLSVIPEELSKQYQRDDNVRTLLKSMHDAFDFANHEDTLRSIKPKSKQADVLALMLRNVCICSDFIQSYVNDSRFLMRMVKSMGGGVEEKIEALSAAFVENRRAFLDQAVITAEITAFQILNDMGNISAKLEWVSSQVSDR